MTISVLDLTSTFPEREDDAFAVTTETDAEAALSRLSEADIDCVVSDYEIPGIDGFELLDR